MQRTTGVILVLLAAAAVLRAASPEFDSLDDAGEEIALGDINLGVAEADESEVQALIARLGDPEYATREAAVDDLARLGPGAFRTMSRAYRAMDDYEVRARIEEIARAQFLWHTLLKRRGFLGIGYAAQGAAALPDGRQAVAITHVEPESAAGEAGLLPGDLIVTVDGEGFGPAADQVEFKDRVQRKGAGGKLHLELLRGSRTIEVDVTLRARPIHQYSEPEMLEDLNRHLQAYAAWWARYFSLPETRRERTPSSTVLALPD